MSRPSARAVVALVVLAVAGCTSPAPEPEPSATTTTAPDPTPSTTAPSPTPTGPSYGQGVAAGHPLAVDAGAAVLADGGNAVDAAIAASFAVSVVEPFASGIGGGGATLVAGPDMEPVAYDYREVVAVDGVIPASGTGVPGHVAGMAALHEAHGSLPWADLLAPAIRLAADGFDVSAFLALRMWSDYGPAAVQGSPTFAPGGAPLAAGDRLVQPELAATLSAIASDGAAAFYTGSIAADLAQVPGLDAETLAGYEVVESAPASGSFAGHEVISAAPALPGAALIQILQVAEAAGIADTAPGSAAYVETMSDAWGVAGESARTVLGDPAYVDVPLAELTDTAANGALAQQVALPSDPGGDPGPPVTAGNTTHLTVVDDEGTVVSMTNTITSFWGSGETVAGFFLNDQLSRFEAIPSAANQPSPGRRSVSWAAPTIVLDADGAPVLGIGSPGGAQIPSILSNVLVRHLLHDEPLADAVAAPRFVLRDGVLTAESHLSPEAGAGVEALGWAVERVAVEQAVFGSVQLLAIAPDGTVSAAVDDRREGDATVLDP